MLANTLLDESGILDVPKGVTLRFAPGVYLQVDGTLIVAGTDEDPVLFTSHGSGYWGGLRVTAASANKTAIEYLILEYADSFNVGKAALHIEGAQPTLEEIVLRHNRFPLLLGAGAGMSATFRGGRIEQNLNGVYLTFGTNILENTLISFNSSPQHFGVVNACEGNEIRNNTFSNNYDLAIQLIGCSQQGTTIVEGNDIYNNAGAIAHSSSRSNYSAVISENQIETNSEVSTWPTAWSNTQAAVVVGCNISLTGNNLVGNNTTYAIRVVDGSACDIQAIDNWWGTASAPMIQTMIYDYFDDFELGKVIYEPFAQGPN